MGFGRKKQDQDRIRAGAEQNAARGSARHAAQHAKKRSLFGSSRREEPKPAQPQPEYTPAAQPVPQHTAYSPAPQSAPQQAAAPQTYTYTYTYTYTAPPGQQPVPPVYAPQPPFQPAGEQPQAGYVPQPQPGPRRLNIMQPASRQETPEPQPQAVPQPPVTQPAPAPQPVPPASTAPESEAVPAQPAETAAEQPAASPAAEQPPAPAPAPQPEQKPEPKPEKETAEAAPETEAQKEPDEEEEDETGSRRKRKKKHRKEKTRAFPSFQAFLDQTLSIHFLCDVFLQQIRKLFRVGVVCTILFMCLLTAIKSFGASTTMSLNYEESLTGKTPNGARFSESEFLTQEYLEAILQATGLQDDLTTLELADCISITPTTSKLVTKADDYYISSSYNLSVQLPWNLWGKITAQNFLDEICRVYLKRFTADYRVNATSLDLNFDYTEMDYEEIGSYFRMMIDRINNYLTVRNDQAGSYLSTSGQSYSAIKKQVQNLQGYTLSEYQSYIWENGVAKNNARCIDDLNELNRTLRWSELSDSQKSEIFMTILDNYNNKMVSSVLIPTYDNDGSFYMSRTKIGIDDLALRANDLLSSSVEAQKSITTNNSKIAALEQPTEPHEQQVAQAMVDAITQQLTDIVSETRALDADCYAQRISSYLVFSYPDTSFIERYSVKPSVMIAALICVVCYLVAVVKVSSQRQRNRLKAENE